jgi:dolichol-phosphate mannosyltransferase
MSEREGPQRERGATRAVRPAATPGGPAEERAQREREGPQRERGATRAVRPAATPGGPVEERAQRGREGGQPQERVAGFAGVGRVMVVIPTYNEVANLESVIARLRAAVPEAHALVVDDSSPDGTGELADRLAVRDDRVRVLHRAQKAGLGAAYIAGFRQVLGEGFDAVVEMDADGSHAPEELPRLLAALRDADLVLGSRWVPGGEVRNWPRVRQLISRGGNLYARLLLRFPVRDATGGYRAYRRVVLETLKLDEVASQGYCFQIDLAWKTWREGFRVVEVPITFTERVQGQSKMSRAIVTEALWRVAQWGLTQRSGSARAKALARRG